MQSLPLDVTSPNDPTSAAKTDGLAFTSCGDNIVVYGGWAYERIWKFHLPSATWSEVITTGSVPPARIYHASAFYNGHLLVTGGELMAPPSYGHWPQHLPYYELNLETFEWMNIECYGSVPQPRSHHTSNVVKESLVVFGGKLADGKPVTAAVLGEAKRVGFFDVHILHIISRTWRKVEMYDPATPMIWGHSAVNFRDSYILFFGGFDVSSPEFAGSPFSGFGSGASDAPPVASLSDVVHILKMDNFQWMRFTPKKDEPSPLPRAMHCAEAHGAEMIVFGGMSIDHIGRTITINDCWVWNVEFGTWGKLEFCLPAWPTKKLISCMYFDQLVVSNQLASVFFLDLTKRGTGWQRVTCSAAPKPIEAIASAEQLRQPPPGMRPASPPRIQEQLEAPIQKASIPTPQPQSAAVGPYRKPHSVEQYESEVDTLRREVDRLRTELKQAPVVKTTVVPNAQQQSGSAMEKQHAGLQKWASVAATTSGHTMLPTTQYANAPSSHPAKRATSPPSFPKVPDPVIYDRPPGFRSPADKKRQQKSKPDFVVDNATQDYSQPLAQDWSSERHVVTSPRKDQGSNSFDNVLDISARRQQLVQQRKEKVKRLQSRLAELEGGANSKQSMAMVKAVMAESNKIVGLIDDSKKTVVQRIVENHPTIERPPPTQNVDAVNATVRRYISPQRSSSKEQPLMMQRRAPQAPKPRNPTPKAREVQPRSYQKAEPVFQPYTQQPPQEEFQFEPVTRGQPPRRRSPSPISQYWDDLEKALDQQPPRFHH